MIKRNRISVSSYTEWFYNFFASVGFNRTLLHRGKDGEFIKTSIKGWRLILFIFIRTQVYIKISYLIAIHYGSFGKELDFFETFGVGIWIATLFVTVLSDYYYMSPFPCFETLCAFWNVQSEIFEKLSISKRETFRKQLDLSARARTKFHMIMSSLAMVGLAVQFVLAPKGNLFTGSWITDEPLWVTVILGVHEEVVLFATWAQAVSVILIPVLAGMEMTICLETLAQEVLDLIEERERSIFMANSVYLTRNDDFNSSQLFNRPKSDLLTKFDLNLKFQRRPISETVKYTIDLILREYKKLYIISERLRYMSSFIMLIAMVIYFAQISSDVFVAIRLVQYDAYVDIGFYAADCTVGMTYWFVSLNCLSRLEDALIEFNSTVMSYFRQDYPGRKFHVMEFKTLQKVAVYVGPCPILRCTVGTCMSILVNYYILAAMW